MHELSTGDWVILLLPDRTRRHDRVEAIYTVAPDDLTPLYPTVEDRLTLITCHTFDPAASTYRERLVISAVRIPLRTIAQTPIAFP